MDLLKAPSFPYQKWFHYKGHLSLAAEVQKGFSSAIFNWFCAIHSKNSNSGNLRPKGELIRLLFLNINFESYGYQLRQLTGSIPSSIFLDSS